MAISIILIIIGFVLLIKGADFLVNGASSIAKKFNIPEIVIGLTIISIGTSMPELVVSLHSAVSGHSDISIGNVLGSNLSNLLLILGTCAVIRPLKFKKETRIIESPLTVILTAIFFIMANTSHIIKRSEGLIMLLLCALFIIYNMFMAKRGAHLDEEDDGRDIDSEPDIEVLPTWESIIYIIIGIVGLKIGGDLVVDNAVNIATILGISELLISLTIVAISTSLPELVTGITATRKGEVDMAIGNIVGSNIFNILLIIGASATVCPINYDVSYNSEMYLLLISSVLFVTAPYVGRKNYLGRLEGAAFVLTYLGYLTFLVLNNI